MGPAPQRRPQVSSWRGLRHTILSYGEYIELTRSMRPDAEVPPALVAWFAGERWAPETLQLALEAAAVHVADARGHELLSTAARRMRQALGRDEFRLRPAAAG